MKQERMNQEPAWSHPLAVADLPPEGAALKLVPGEKERAACLIGSGVGGAFQTVDGLVDLRADRRATLVVVGV